MLTSNQVSKFQELYRKHFGESINRVKAAEMGERLVNFVRVVQTRDHQVRNKPQSNDEYRL